ncbi:MAG: hypothetical protein JNM60_02815 [Candidatus Competibacteraceae bacterium]|nr:hypothetical protein [Candidatus Competibacteraceae bacterium]
MAIVHELKTRHRDLLNDLDELDDSIAELSDTLNTAPTGDEDLLDNRRQHLGWLERQRAGLLVMLNETERALLEAGEDGWDKP